MGPQVPLLSQPDRQGETLHEHELCARAGTYPAVFSGGLGGARPSGCPSRCPPQLAQLRLAPSARRRVVASCLCSPALGANVCYAKERWHVPWNDRVSALLATYEAHIFACPKD